MTLVVSRFQFVWPTFLQTTEAVCEGLDATWRFFGAMARVLVLDNMAAVIALADPLAPTIVAAFQDYVQTRGIFVNSARRAKSREHASTADETGAARSSSETRSRRCSRRPAHRSMCPHVSRIAAMG